MLIVPMALCALGTIAFARLAAQRPHKVALPGPAVAVA